MDKASTVQYWDTVADHVFPNRSRVSDNWWKRQCLVKHLLDYSFDGRSVLEIGCGAGVTAGALHLLHGGEFTYVGTDISPKFADVARSLWGFDTVVSGAHELPFGPGGFDILFAFDVLEHIEPDMRISTYKRLSTVLKDKAMVFINNPDAGNLNGHAKNFDFGMDFEDVVAMAKVMGMCIERVAPYAVIDGKKNVHKYQFIVLNRGIL